MTSSKSSRGTVAGSGVAENGQRVQSLQLFTPNFMLHKRVSHLFFQVDLSTIHNINNRRISFKSRADWTVLRSDPFCGVSASAPPNVAAAVAVLVTTLLPTVFMV